MNGASHSFVQGERGASDIGCRDRRRRSHRACRLGREPPVRDGDWHAGAWDERRSIPIELFGAIAEVPRVRVHLLHSSPITVPGLTVAAGTDTILGTARLMRALDLVISVDSMPAHLAGALGVPVWTLLRKAADWRWMEHREDSPWYPTMRLFRQERPDEWQPVVARVAAELSQLSARDFHSRRERDAAYRGAS